MGVAELVEGDYDVGVGALAEEVTLKTDEGASEDSYSIAQMKGTVDEGDGLWGVAQHVLQTLDLGIGDDGVAKISCNGRAGSSVCQELIDGRVDMEHVEALLWEDVDEDLGIDDDALGHTLGAILVDMEFFLAGHVGLDALFQKVVADDSLHGGTDIYDVPKGLRRYASGRGRVQRRRSR